MTEPASKEITLKNKLGIFVKFILPISIPILYIQGVAFYEGVLHPYNLSDGLYPLTIEQTFVRTFSLYMWSIKWIFLLAIVWMFIMLPINIIGDFLDSQERSETAVKFANWLNTFAAKHKIVFVISGIIGGFAYLLIFLGVLILPPYYIGEHQTIKKLRAHTGNMEQRKFFQDTATIYLKNKIPPITGSIKHQSDKAVTVINDGKFIIIPFSNINTIEYELIKE